jgi:hypothetical protein
MAVPQRDTDAKSFAAVADKAVVYIYRDERIGAAIKMPLMVDNKNVADTVARSYIRLELSAGNHEIVSKAENESNLTLSAEAGKVYYVWQEVKMGLMFARSKLQLMPEEKGQASVKKCTLLEASGELPK